MPIAYQTVEGVINLLTKNGGLCSTCCISYPFKLGQIWLALSCGGYPTFFLTGDASPWAAAGKAPPSVYWRIWDWTLFGQECYLRADCTNTTVAAPAHGQTTILGQMQVWDVNGIPQSWKDLDYYFSVRSELTTTPHYVDIQISKDGTTWPSSP